MGMFEYDAQMSEARSPEDMTFVADAFRAGEKKQQDRVWELLESKFKQYSTITISKKELKKIIYDNVH